MPIAGPVVASADGTAYFATTDSLHALVAPGVEKWQTLDGGNSIAVSPDGSTVYAHGKNGDLYAFAADGKLKWKADVAVTQGPLAASADSVFVVSNGGVVAVTSPGLVEWQAPVSGTVAASAALPDGGLIVATAGGAVTDLSASGTVRWTFTPDGGFAGSVAIESGTVYVGSQSGAVYALDATTGSETWQFKTGAKLLGGPVADSQGSVFFASNSIYALDASGKTLWSRPLLSNGPVVLTGTSDGLFFATSDGLAAVVADDGTTKWATRSFGTVASATFSPLDALYVVNTKGRIYDVK